MSLEQVRSTNWSGCLPVILTLAPTSLSSPTIPPPIHVLLSRHNFLHVGLQDAVFRLQQYAPPSFSFANRTVNEPDTVEDSSQEDAETMHTELSGDFTEKQDGRSPLYSKKQAKYPLCWFEDEETELPLQWQLFAGVLYDCHSCRFPAERQRLPWRIRVHFTNYPSSHLLDLDALNGDVLTTIQRTFRNSLKQAMVLEHGQNKVALNMTKQTHERIWDSIVTSKYVIYKPIQEDIQATRDSLDIIPIRLVIGPSKPLIQKRCSNPELSLGGLLHEWLPHHFRITDAAKQTVEPVAERMMWRIAGLSPSLETLVVDLWQSLCQPDSFLYIVVVHEQ